MSEHTPEEFRALSDERLAAFLSNPFEGAPSENAEHAHQAEPDMRPEWQVRIECAVDMSTLLESVMPLVLEWAETVAGREVAPAVSWDDAAGLTLGYRCPCCAEEVTP
jgi:hypothetical protein